MPGKKPLPPAYFLGFMALILGTLAPFLLTFFFAVLIDLRFIRTEEKMLDASFGEKWQSYKAGVRKWI